MTRLKKTFVHIIIRALSGFLVGCSSVLGDIFELTSNAVIVIAGSKGNIVPHSLPVKI